MPHTTTPIDSRVYVSPTGERCRLIVGRVTGPWIEPQWSVELLNEHGMSPIAGQPAIQITGRGGGAGGLPRAAGGAQGRGVECGWGEVLAAPASWIFAKVRNSGQAIALHRS